MATPSRGFGTTVSSRGGHPGEPVAYVRVAGAEVRTPWSAGHRKMERAMSVTDWVCIGGLSSLMALLSFVRIPKEERVKADKKRK